MNHDVCIGRDRNNDPLELWSFVYCQILLAVGKVTIASERAFAKGRVVLAKHRLEIVRLALGGRTATNAGANAAANIGAVRLVHGPFHPQLGAVVREGARVSTSAIASLGHVAAHGGLVIGAVGAHGRCTETAAAAQIPRPVSVVAVVAALAEPIVGVSKDMPVGDQRSNRRAGRDRRRDDISFS